MSALEKVLTIQLPRPHEAQRQIIREARRFNVVDCGRRWGKTTLAIDRLAGPALNGYPTAYFAPTYKMLTEVWRAAKNIFQPVVRHTSTQDHRLELITGGVIDMWSLDNPDAARGRKYKRVIPDEFAMVVDGEEAWNKVLRPTLTDYEGDAWFKSTPRGLNFFWQLWQRGQDPMFSDWASWQMPTITNPHISPSEIESARNELPAAVFEQEYLAQFIQNEGAVFRNVEANLTAGPTTPEEHKGHRIVIGIDWAQKHDFTVISIGCATCNQELMLDRFNKIEWAFQRARVKAAIERWGVKDGYVELNSIGSPNFEALRNEGMPVRGFETTQGSKAEIIQSLALALERQEFAFLPDPVGKHELLAYESKVSANGRISYSAPEGGHDDTVIGRALMHKAAADKGAVQIVPMRFR